MINHSLAGSATALLLVVQVPALGGAADLEAGFAAPPQSARPWAYWWWLDGYATPAGITMDLEEMKRQGLGGVLLFDAGEGGPDAPKGPVFMSPAWLDLYRHALREAARLEIEVGVNLCSGWNAGGTWVTPEHAAKTLVWSAIDVKGPEAVRRELPRPECREGYYRDVAVVAYPTGTRPANAKPLKHWDVKAARAWLNMPPDRLHEEEPETPGERDCDPSDVVDLSAHMDSAGRLTWDAPNGAWTVLRFGYTLLGAKTKCVSPGSQGLEIDFFSTAAMDAHWAETGARLIAEAGTLAGKTLRYVHDDSYEVCGPNGLQMNWTPAFREEFKARRGYDLLPYLPVLAGRIVGSRGVSNRFLWDYRRTIGDLFAAGHYRRMRELAARHGLGTHPESGGPFWPCIDALDLVGTNDIPMGEFWKRVPERPDGKVIWADPDNYRICDTVRQAASAAHIYGKPVCQAEAFTSMGPNWEEDFFDLKDIGDRAFCAGLTRNVLCFYVHQGDADALPGYQWEAAGTHFDRHVTWWGLSHGWMRYLSRCQYMLRQGLFVADLLYFYGEDVPNYVPAREYMKPALPAGYDCDVANADVLLNRLQAKAGRLTLPDGMSYRLLVLPERRAMSPRILRKVRELVEAGATVIGPKAKRAPGLSGYPECDAEVRRLADALWGDVNGRTVTERKVGLGRIIWGKSLSEVLAADGVPPDFEYHATGPDARLDFIHRAAGDVQIYFVSNQRDREERADCVFRVADKQPELWDAVTGERRDARRFRQENGRTALPLAFAPRQSWFVVFRGLADGAGDSTAPNVPVLTTASELRGAWTVKFDPRWGGPESIVFERLEDWTGRSEPGIKYYSGKAVYEKRFYLPAPPARLGREVYLDLGRVKNVAQVTLNGKDLGVIWTAPWHVNITEALRPTDNALQIAVVNLWPNRLIGDAALPPGQRLTKTNVKKFKKDMPLLESGLLGPVTLRYAER